MNEAGIMAVPPELTADGNEIQFGANHGGQGLLTKLLPTIPRKSCRVDMPQLRPLQCILGWVTRA